VPGAPDLGTGLVLSESPIVGSLSETAGFAVTAPADETRLIEALRRGDETAFAELLDLYSAALLRLALVYVRSRAVAEEVVQETWLGVIRGIDSFEGRSSLKTWVFRILANQAKTKAQREGRTVPFSSLESELEAADPAVSPERFADPGHARWPNHWTSPPASWDGIPEDRLLSRETLSRIQEAIDVLPNAQRAVITLRDVEGWPSDEVCALLGVSEANQRVLLHRARSKVRGALEEYLGEDAA
jgi:RNA polymerase sigma-70 factor (ECF subfamily)